MTKTKFIAKWKHCINCPLHQCRYNIVLYRGDIPAQILFIGEAPGPSENVIGKPFVGPAGKLQEKIVEEASIEADYNPTYCYTNVVCCYPATDIFTDKSYRAPKKEEVDACRERLIEFVHLVRPRIIITLGKIPKSHVPTIYPNLKKQPLIKSQLHPSAILQIDDAEKAELEFKRAVVHLARTIKYLTGEIPWPEKRPPKKRRAK